MLNRFNILLAAVLALALLAGCQTSPTQSPTQPPAATGYPAGDPTGDPAATSYPVSTPVLPTFAYPAPGDGPAGVPVLENRSRVSAQLVEQLADPSDAGMTILRAVILSSEPVNGMPDRTAGLINQTVDLYAPTANLPALAPGDTFTAEVSYRGDEQGGKYFGENVTK